MIHSEINKIGTMPSLRFILIEVVVLARKGPCRPVFQRSRDARLPLDPCVATETKTSNTNVFQAICSRKSRCQPVSSTAMLRASGTGPCIVHPNTLTARAGSYGGCRLVVIYVISSFFLPPQKSQRCACVHACMSRTFRDCSPVLGTNYLYFERPAPKTGLQHSRVLIYQILTSTL